MVNPTEHRAHTPSAKTSVGAMLGGMFRGPGSGAPATDLSSRLACYRARATFALLFLSVLGGMASLAGTFTVAPALAAEACPNEAVRAQSDVDPTTGEPYSQGLPECRAYEMVSPLEKQAHDVGIGGIGGINGVTVSGVDAIAPDGDRIQILSKGNFGEPGNGFGATNGFVAHRDAAGWEASSVLPPASLVEGWNGLALTPDLARAAYCGNPGGPSKQFSSTALCLLAQADGSYVSTPGYLGTTGVAVGPSLIGASRDLSVVVFTNNGFTGQPLLPADRDGFGLYRVSGLGTVASPGLELINVDNVGNELTDVNTPYVGNRASLGVALDGNNNGNRSHAVSGDGQTIYFTATPSGGARTLFARTGDFAGGTPTAPTTVAISNPSPAECTTCSATASEGIFQSASEDGSKAFFLTKQQLVNADTDSTTDLYEYDFDTPPGQHLTQISGGGPGDPSPGSGAQVQGVTSISADGSHVYFVATGVLTNLPNALGQTAVAGADNLYGYDTDTSQTSFVATVPNSDAGLLWNSIVRNNLAQTTPDGRYLLFATTGALTADDTDTAQDVYRYDAQTGQLVRVSHGAGPGGSADFGNDGNTAGKDATFFAQRAISDDGSTVVFATPEQLQADDVNGAANGTCTSTGGGVGCDVYVWHDGTVAMISDGQGPNPQTTGSEIYGAGLSASGSDIFFQTRTALVGQDTDQLVDVYDARIGGGFPYTPPSSCAGGEACQGPPSQAAPGTATPASSTFTGLGNAATPPPAKQKGKPTKCRKGFAKKHGKCVKRATHKSHKSSHRRASARRHANADRRASR